MIWYDMIVLVAGTKYSSVIRVSCFQSGDKEFYKKFYKIILEKSWQMDSGSCILFLVSHEVASSDERKDLRALG